MRGVASAFFPTLILVLLSLLCSACGSGGSSESSATSSWVKRWNQVAIDAARFDHSPESAGEQRGPVRQSRAFAIVHLAIAEAVGASSKAFTTSYLTTAAPENTSLKAAIAQAAHDALLSVYPSQSETFASALTQDLSQIPESSEKTNGIELGAAAATAVLSARLNDGSEFSEPLVPVNYTPGTAPGQWRPDPINPGQKALGSEWSRVKPFVISDATQFRAPAPPSIDSLEYAASYDEAKRLGGDGITTPTERTPEQTEIGIFWAYDGTPGIGAPINLYNQIALTIAEDHGLEAIELARLLALVNVAMADTGISTWESKYFYEYWRPITAIREADSGTGPSGLGDGNANTAGDPNYLPLCAPASNSSNENFTPPFPAYPSGHAAFGSATFEILRRYFGSDQISFTFTSDELNGSTTDNRGQVRQKVTRSFSSLSQAEEENGQSRIYLGIHWSFDKTAGFTQGREVAKFVFENALQNVAVQVSSKDPLTSGRTMSL